MLITNVTIVTHESELNNHWMKIQAGIIESMGPMGTEPSDAETIDATNCYLLPGAIDIHVHGTMGGNAMDSDASFFDVMGENLAKNGTTSYLMTTMTESLERIKSALSHVKDYKYNGGAEMLGIHLEGPFISEKYKGAQNSDYILAPDAALLDTFVTLADGNIKVVTYAPEHDVDFKFLDALKSHCIIPSIGHSDATYQLLVEMEDRTALHLTHFYNGMRGLHHREAGVVGFGMMNSPYVELICDGIHVSRDMIRLTYETIGAERLMIITDAMHAQGLDDGIYTFGGQEVELKSGEARLLSGSLAGSVVTMRESVKNMKDFTGCRWRDIARMTAYNQAQRLQLMDRGVLEVGKRADMVLYDAQAELLDVFVQGVRI